MVQSIPNEKQNLALDERHSPADVLASEGPTVPVLHKAMRVLRVLSNTDHPLHSIGVLAAEADVPTTTCFRIVNTLAAERLLQKPGPDAPSYRLAAGLLTLLSPLQGAQDLVDRMKPRLSRLAKLTGLGVKLSIREGNETVTLAKAEPPVGVSVTYPVGSRFMVATGSAGAALLADLDNATVAALLDSSPVEAWQHQTRELVWERIDDARRDGVVIDHGSYRAELAGASAAIQSLNANEPQAVITVTGLAVDFDRLDLSSLRAALLDAAGRGTEADT